jgi:hypothetical protein
VDFGYLQITLRDGKGGRDRRTMVPVFLVDALRKQIAKVAELHCEDLSAGAGEVNLPFALSQSTLLAATSRRSAISRPSCAESRSSAPELNRGQAGWIR